MDAVVGSDLVFRGKRVSFLDPRARVLFSRLVVVCVVCVVFWPGPVRAPSAGLRDHGFGSISRAEGAVLLYGAEVTSRGAMTPARGRARALP